VLCGAMEGLSASPRTSKRSAVQQEVAKKKPAKRTVAKKKIAKQAAKKKKNTRRTSRTVQAKAAYCVNLANQETLLARNADKPMPVASLTKLVTALVTLDRMQLDRKVTVPDHIKKVPKTVVGLKPGDMLTVNDLLHGLLIGSGNDCAETLACAYPGGKSQFLRAMNKKVRELGTTHTVFYTPSGLDRKVAAKDGDATEEADSNLSTAREMARISRAAFANNIIKSICLKKFHVLAGNDGSKKYRVSNTNKLLRDRLPLAGGKTGFTCRAGHCLATAFNPGRNNFLIVVLGSPDHFGDTRLIYRDALKASLKSTKKVPVIRAGRGVAVRGEGG
jgi:D-alanyl-D-alanine carboxypeptidase